MYQPPHFKAIKLAAFATVTRIMGEPAVWETALPLEVAGVGLFKDPTGKMEIVPSAARSDGAEYNSTLPEFRYAIGQFPGLYELVRAGSIREILRLSDGRRYLVGDFDKKFDGETYVALLEQITR